MAIGEMQREAKEHAQRYIQAVFAQRLIENGFINYQQDDLSWYRLIGEDVLHIVRFLAYSPMVPVSMQIGYGTHPVFLPPLFSTKLDCRSTYYTEEILEEFSLSFCDSPLSSKYYSLEARVLCPNKDHNGLYALDNIIFPKMEQAKSIAECYALHKTRVVESWKQSLDYYDFLHVEGELRNSSFALHFSAYLMDEAIYVGDRELYPFFEVSLAEQIRRIDDPRWAKTISSKEAEHLLLLKQAIFEGNTAPILQYLDNAQSRNLRLIKKKLGL